jgi:[protein-PII] uridylyltransferase
VAMVGGKVDQVIDIFYIRDINGDQKIESDEKLELIKTSILNTLPHISAKEVLNEKN